MDITKYQTTVLGAIEMLENSSIQSLNNAKNALKEQNMMIKLKPVNANVKPQDQLTQQLRPVNVQEERFGQIISVTAQVKSHYGMVEIVLLALQEQHSSQKIDNVTIAQKDLLRIQ